MIRKVIQIIKGIIKNIKKPNITQKDDLVLELSKQFKLNKEQDRSAEKKLVTSEKAKKFLIISRRYFSLSGDGKLKLESLSKNKKIEKLSKLIEGDVPLFSSANDVLDYFEKKYGLDRFKLAMFSASNRSDFYYRTVKMVSGKKERAILIPSKFARKVQKVILNDILSKLEFPPEFCGFVKNRSIKDAVFNHIGKNVLLSLDIKNFFDNTSDYKVYRAFKFVLGYPHEVSLFLTGLTTANIIHTEDRVKRRVIPTGSPTSPCIANLCMIPIFDKMKQKLGQIAKNNNLDLHFSIYADNIVISYNPLNQAFSNQDLRIINNNIVDSIRSILKKSKYELNENKTRIMRKRKKVLGLVVNKKLNIDRKYYKNLRAQVHNFLYKKQNSVDNYSSSDQYQKIVQHLKGKLGYLRFINPGKYEAIRRKYCEKIPEIFNSH
ncbi:MAG: reverse transcriptase family protein [bacterium]|nr:reverse transcriptase family protein [bacterium]